MNFKCLLECVSVRQFLFIVITFTIILTVLPWHHKHTQYLKSNSFHVNVFRNKNDTDAFKNTPTIEVAFIFINPNARFEGKLINCLKSIWQFWKQQQQLQIHFFTNEDSRSKCQYIIQYTLIQSNLKRRDLIKFHIYNLSEKLHPYQEHLNELRKFFTSLNSYYRHDLFFASLFMHHILSVPQVLLLDIDTQFIAPIDDLYVHFNNFEKENLFGMAPELSPVYYHILYSYRHKHPDSLFGQPHTKGKPGLNAGVILLHLDNIRNLGIKWKWLISNENVSKLCNEFNMHGHLGDQDLYSLWSWANPKIIYQLPCGWNRQLCTWWKSHGYADLFDLFHQCSTSIYLYHANCNSIFPHIN